MVFIKNLKMGSIIGDFVIETIVMLGNVVFKWLLDCAQSVTISDVWKSAHSLAPIQMT